MPLSEEIQELIYKLRDMNRKFRLACSQLILINNLIEETEVRLQRAKVAGRHSHRYILRHKLITLEGISCMFYAYAYGRAEELEVLQQELYEETGIAWNDELARLHTTEPVLDDHEGMEVDEYEVIDD